MYSKVFMAYLPEGVTQSWLVWAKSKVMSNHRKVVKKRGCTVQYNTKHNEVELIAPPKHTTSATSRWL